MEESQFPMRINKYLALKKYSTRRGADEIIKKKQVFINDRVAVLGDKVKATDTVTVKLHAKPAPLLYFAYNKPRGVAAAGEEVMTDKKKNERTANSFPVAALDKESDGLMLFTNDGRITDRLLSPLYEHEREYVVTTKNTLRSSFKQKMEAGVLIEGTKTEKCRVQILNENTFRVTLTDEKKHQLRRMCVALFQDVDQIKCVRIMNIHLGDLKEGTRREIIGNELKTFLSALKLI